jgi:hypothetical protein
VRQCSNACREGVTAGSAARKGAVGMCRSTAHDGKFRRIRRCFDLKASKMCAYGGSGTRPGGNASSLANQCLGGAEEA